MNLEGPQNYYIRFKSLQIGSQILQKMYNSRLSLFNIIDKSVSGSKRKRMFFSFQSSAESNLL